MNGVRQFPQTLPCSHRGFADASGIGAAVRRPRADKKGGARAPPCRKAPKTPQVRRVSTKFWPDELVQFNWLVETMRQLKPIGDWRISEVPVISTEVAPVIL